MRQECWETFPPPPISNETIMHVPWWMSGSLNRDGGKTFQAFPAHAQPTLSHICQEAHNLYSWHIQDDWLPIHCSVLITWSCYPFPGVISRGNDCLCQATCVGDVIIIAHHQCDFEWRSRLSWTGDSTGGVIRQQWDIRSFPNPEHDNCSTW